MNDPEFAIWRFWAWFKHLFWVHTWVPREDWKMTENGAEITIIGYICWLCPAKRDLD